MKTRLTRPARPKLATPWPIQYWEPQLFALLDIGRKNERNMNELGRKGAELLIHVADMNGGQIPTLNQIMLRRAKQDARKAKR